MQHIGKEMSKNDVTLSNLSVDILLVISGYLSGQDLDDFASVNSSFRKHLASAIFKTLRVANDKDCATAAGTIAQHYGQVVRTINFCERTEVWKENQRPRTSRPQSPTLQRPLLGAGVRSILDGTRFPKANSNVVCLEHTYTPQWTCARDENFIQKQRHVTEFLVEEPDDNLPSSEETMRWQAMMAEVWNVIAKNENVQHLKIEPLISKMTTAFVTGDFRSMLSRLESLHIVTSDVVGHGHEEFLWRTDEIFFKYLASVRTLKIEMPEIINLLPSLKLERALERSSSNMPKLQLLELGRSFVGMGLLTFILRGHANTLQTLLLDGCVCRPNYCLLRWPEPEDTGRFYGWGNVLKDLRLHCRSLLKLEVTPCDGFEYPIYSDIELKFAYSCVARYENRNGQGIWEQPEHVTAVRKKLQEDPRLQGFEYFEMTRSHSRATLMPAGLHWDVTKFQMGDDQREWHSLQEVLSERRARRG